VNLRGHPQSKFLPRLICRSARAVLSSLRAPSFVSAISKRNSGRKPSRASAPTSSGRRIVTTSRIDGNHDQRLDEEPAIRMFESWGPPSSLAVAND